MNDESDVLVCGAGMAGLCAAVTAAQAGARVLVLEKAERLGGSMRLSGGTVWTAPSMAVMERYVGGGDRERQRRLVAGIGPGLAWLAGLGVPDGLAIENEAQVGRELDPEALTEGLSTAVAAAGGRIVAESAVDELRRDAHGAIRGAVTRSADGHRRTVRARAVILATGGFQGNHELLARFVGRFADRLLIRSNPYSVGDGLLAALTAGAGTSPNMSTFYGHTMPAVPADPPPAAWTSVTQYATGDAIIINERGERFFDESRSLADELASSEIIQQPNGRAFLLVDDRLYRDEPLPGRSTQPLGANFDRAVASGARRAAQRERAGRAARARRRAPTERCRAAPPAARPAAAAARRLRSTAARRRGTRDHTTAAARCASDARRHDGARGAGRGHGRVDADDVRPRRRGGAGPRRARILRRGVGRRPILAPRAPSDRHRALNPARSPLCNRGQ